MRRPLAALSLVVAITACDQRADVRVLADATADVATNPRGDRAGEAGSWVFTAGGPGSDFGRMVIDPETGEVTVAGRFQGTATFGDWTISTDAVDAFFVARLEPSGKLRWVVPVQAATSALAAWPRVAVDSAGNAYLSAAGFTGGATAGVLKAEAEGPNNVLLVKIDRDGVPRWALPLGGPKTEPFSYSHSTPVGVDATGAVTLTGVFAGTMQLGNTELVSKGASDLFVARLDPEGKVLWAKGAGGAADDRANAIAVDAAGGVTIAGTLWGAASFGEHTLETTRKGELYVARLDAGGSFRWASTAASSGRPSLGGWPIDLMVDQAGNAYVGGHAYAGAVGACLPLVAAVDATGRFLWELVAEGTPTDGRDAGSKAVIDKAGRLGVTGWFTGIKRFDASHGVMAAGGEDIFLASLDPKTGAVHSVESHGGAGNDNGYALAIDREGSLYLGGVFGQSVSLAGHTLQARGGTDLFVWKLPPSSPEP